MPGNTADVTLMLPVVKRLRERFGIREACIVADRGMISADTIAALEAENIEYILGVRERTSREVRAEIIEDAGLTVPLVIPHQKGETELAIRETTIAGRRYVICRNEDDAKKNAASRAELVAGLERKLAQGDKGAGR
jgi:transposase